MNNFKYLCTTLDAPGGCDGKTELGTARQGAGVVVTVDSDGLINVAPVSVGPPVTGTIAAGKLLRDIVGEATFTAGCAVGAVGAAGTFLVFPVDRTDPLVAVAGRETGLAGGIRFFFCEED